MKKFSTSGFTAAGVLAVALLGGTAGGALVMSHGGDGPATPPTVGVGPVADDATLPSADPTPEPTMGATPAQAPAQAVPAQQEAPVASSNTETAKQAADRAAREADRAAQAASDAEQAASKVTQPAATPAAPVATPKPAPTPEPTPGANTRAGDPCVGYEGTQMQAGNGPSLKCVNGTWRTVPEPPAPSPTPVDRPPGS